MEQLTMQQVITGTIALLGLLGGAIAHFYRHVSTVRDELNKRVDSLTGELDDFKSRAAARQELIELEARTTKTLDELKLDMREMREAVLQIPVIAAQTKSNGDALSLLIGHMRSTIAGKQGD